MSQSTNGMLVYGYDLGEEPAFVGLDAEHETPTWYDLDNDDFISAAEERLRLVIAKFDEEWRPGSSDSGYFTRRKAADEAVGVTLDTYCSGEYPLYLIGAHIVTVHRGDTITLDLVELERQRIAEDWDGKLAAAVAALGLAVDGSPRWLLASYWG